MSRFFDFFSQKEAQLDGIDYEALEIVTRAEADLDIKVKLLHQNVLILEESVRDLAEQLGTDIDE